MEKKGFKVGDLVITKDNKIAKIIDIHQEQVQIRINNEYNIYVYPADLEFYNSSLLKVTYALCLNPNDTVIEREIVIHIPKDYVLYSCHDETPYATTNIYQRIRGFVQNAINYEYPKDINILKITTF